MANRKAVVFGVEGTELTAEETSFFKDVNPAGFILFSRNIADAEQVRRLTESLRECVGDGDIMILTDEEGGRVRRFRPPLFRDYPAVRRIGELAETDYKDASRFAYLNALMMGTELLNLGVNVDCAPVLDLLFDNADKVIGDRAFAKDPSIVKSISGKFALGLIHAGVTPVIKHIPGHGRAMKDTHTDIVKVDASIEDMKNTDFVPFCCFPHPVFGMMSHIVYTAVDADHPATLSGKVRRLVENELGFHGILFSDDFSMGALTGFESDMRSLAGQALSSGAVDIILHCNGNLDEMVAIASAVTRLSDEQQRTISETLAQKRLFRDWSDIVKEYEDLYGRFFSR